MDEKKPEKDPKKKEDRRPRDNRRRPNQNYRSDNRRDNYRGNRRDQGRDRRDFRRGPRKPMNIRYGTKFCGECRACKFWLSAKFGKYRCENSYLPFEILEFRRDGNNNQITEIVINLLV